MVSFVTIYVLINVLQDWKKCMALLGNRGPDGMRNRMSELNPADVSRKNALDAKVTIEPYTEEQLRYISPGAAAFYNWVGFFFIIYNSVIFL